MSTSSSPFRGFPLALAVAVVAAVATVEVHAQAPDNDYYAFRGSTLLRTVEQYHLGPAEERLRLKHYPQARNEIAFILRFFPNHPRGLLLLGQLCDEWKSPQCMIEGAYERAISVRPNEPTVYIVHGIYLHRNKRYGEAVSNYEKALELDPDSLNGHYNLALTLLDTQQFERANRHAQRAYALGATLPGLRDRLKKAGRWNPDDVLPARPHAGAAPQPESASRQ